MKLKGPKYANDIGRWIRLQEIAIADSEIVSDVILGLNEYPKLKNGELAVDIVLDLEEDILYPTGEAAVDARKFTFKDGARAIPGLESILNAMKGRFSPAKVIARVGASKGNLTLQNMKDVLTPHEYG